MIRDSHSIVVLNNYFGRQFSSLNDVGVHPVNKDVYFTDTLYGYLQDFRPAPGLQNQVYRWNDRTGAVTVVADGFSLPNGKDRPLRGDIARQTDAGHLQDSHSRPTARTPMSPIPASTWASAATTFPVRRPCKHPQAARTM